MPVISYLPSAVFGTGQDNCTQQLDDRIHNLRTSRVTPLIAWKIDPGHPPLVVKDCPKCEQRRHFYCSERFRVDAQQKNLDIWLIYKCQNCDGIWKCTVLRHVSPSSINRDLFDASQFNDRLTSWKYAFDFTLLKRNGVEIDSAIEYTVSGPELLSMSNLPSEVQILLTFDFDGKWRTHAVLSRKLGLSKQKLGQLFSVGGLHFDPGMLELRTRLRDHTILTVDASKLRNLVEASN
jgi:hypothetical protein